MRILLVSYNYAPHLTPRAFRWTALAEHWARHGHEVTVICGDAPGSPASERRNGVEVIRCGRNGVASWLRRHFASHSTAIAAGTASETPVNPPAARGFWHGAARAIRHVHGMTWKKLYWPDYAAMWIPKAFRAAKRRSAETEFDALITSSLPYSAHVVGYLLHRSRREIPWLVDIGDPFALMDATPVNNHRLYHRYNFLNEKAVLSAARVATVTTEGTRDRYLEEFPDLDGKVHVIPPLLSSIPGEVSPESASGPLRLVFVGTLYGRIRSPEVVLAVFRRLLATPLGSRLELHFFGATLDCESVFGRYADLIGTRIHLHGLVPREQALAALSSASVIVNVGNDTPFQLPSKLVEYVASGRPVLSFATSRQDSSLHFLQDYAAAHCVVARDADALTDQDIDAIRKFIEAPPAVTAEAMARKLAPFRLETIAQSYESLLSDASPNSRRKKSV